jgi:hypothetical protein
VNKLGTAFSALTGRIFSGRNWMKQAAQVFIVCLAAVVMTTLVNDLYVHKVFARTEQAEAKRPQFGMIVGRTLNARDTMPEEVTNVYDKSGDLKFVQVKKQEFLPGPVESRKADTLWPGWEKERCKGDMTQRCLSCHNRDRTLRGK